MKIAVIGVGEMGKATIRDLVNSSGVEQILIADYDEGRATGYAAYIKDPRVQGCFIDANNTDETAKIIKGYDAVINTAQYNVNLSVMKACLKAKCHYNDLGGLFHITRKQLELFNDFKKSGLTAVLGMGAAPGITNIMSRYAYDQLDEVEAVRISFAFHDMTDMKGIDVFNPPYSISTLMEEFKDDTMQFIDGEYKILPALSGAEEIVFPEPIGKRVCFHTLHSEPATIPASFKEKGVKEVTWKLSLPPEFEKKSKILAFVGFADQEPMEIKGVKVVPREVLAAVVEKQVKEKLFGVVLQFNEVACIRSNVIGKKYGKNMEYIVDCIVRTQNGISLCATVTGVPASIVAQMQAKRMINEPGAWGPEKIVNPEVFFKELAKRGMHIHVTTREDLYG